ncbi:MAG TPA: UvrD-helicase domain-containing protein [Stellaceae bacterium]|jgi:DNA helicase-2/ATP-dependent DNA helicase PcrA|nr:UvrD-helicase domain-containing protein [Stellaceae bacterium]
MPELAAAVAAPPSAPYLAVLNEAQARAVQAVDGPVLVLAGAGTGKTRVLTTRLGHILATGRAFPGELLAVTFTNKAAREMRERLEAMIGGAADGVWLGTFHAIAARILRRHAELVGLTSSFTILDTDDQLRLIKQVLAAANIDDRRWPARGMLGMIERWKDRGLVPDKVSVADAGDYANGRAVEIYRAYQDRLKTVNATDFGDLLLHNLTLFTGHPDVLEGYQRRFRYILVDEYQDTNVAQYLWLRLLAQQHKNLCCVGDDDQSIYSWRGAQIENILKFESDFPGALIVRLEENYRSTPDILAAAAGVIAHNRGRLGKTLWTRAGEGEKIAVRGVWDAEQEARWVGDEIEAQQRKGHALREIAILVRAGFQTREFEERFIALALPYRVIGGPRFYERAEIRDALAYLRLIQQPADDLAFERIVNTPRRGIGTASLQVLHGAARAGQMPLVETVRMLITGDKLPKAARNSLGNFIQALDRWRAEGQRVAHTDLAQIVLDESGYTGMLQADTAPDAPGRLENLKELVVAMAEFENLTGFLEHISLVMDNAADSGGDLVNLMTLHSAKGLEFDTVFLPGWEEGLFPSQRSMDEQGLGGLEEERRLAYVGLTRARRRALVSFAANRRIHGQWQSSARSRFVDELPGDHIEMETEPGLGGAGGWAASSPWGSSWNTTARTGGGGERMSHTPPRPPVLIETSRVPGRGQEVQKIGGFSVGERVFHQKFGYGVIRAVEDNKLAIDFEHAGDKKVMDAFVERVQVP